MTATCLTYDLALSEYIVNQIRLYWENSQAETMDDIVRTIGAIDAGPNFEITSYREGKKYAYLVVEFEGMDLSELVENIELQGQLFNIEISARATLNGMYKISRYH